MNPIKLKFKTVFSWCLYDWANSSYFTVVTTFIFAAYFTSKIAPNVITGTFWWGNTVAIAAFMVAIFSPIFGAIADYGGHRKVWLFILNYCGIIASFCLWFAYPHPSHAFSTLLFVAFGIFFFETAVTFYNSILPSIVPRAFLGRISGWAWGLGYVGGLLSLTICLYFFVDGPKNFLDYSTYANVRICGPFVALWVLVFSIPLFLFVSDFPSKNYPIKKAINAGIKELMKTLRYLPQEKNMLLFFISRIFYIDGLNTLFAFGGIYAAGTFHMNMAEITVFGIILNVTAGMGAIAFAWIDDWFGAKKTIMVCLALLIISTTMVLLIRTTFYFWVLAPIVGIFVGPIQAASRSLMVRIGNKEKITELFGLFAFSGKATAFIGPWLVATMTEVFLNQRIGMATIVIFFIFGLIAISFVKETK